VFNVFSLVWLHSKDKTPYGFATRARVLPDRFESIRANKKINVRFPHLSNPCFKALTPYGYDTEFAQSD
jgi:hypothetical protein